MKHNLVVIKILLGLCAIFSVISMLFMAKPAFACWNDVECGPGNECVGGYCPMTCTGTDPVTGQSTGCTTTCYPGSCINMYNPTKAPNIECWACVGGTGGFCTRNEIASEVNFIPESCPGPNNCNDCQGSGSSSTGPTGGNTSCGMYGATISTQKATYSNTYTANPNCTVTITHQIDPNTGWVGGNYGSNNYLSDDVPYAGVIDNQTSDATTNARKWRRIFYTDAGSGMVLDNTGEYANDSKCGIGWHGWFENDWSTSTPSQFIVQTTSNNNTNRPHYQGYTLTTSPGCYINLDGQPNTHATSIPFTWNGDTSSNAQFSPGVATCGQGWASLGACVPNSLGYSFGAGVSPSQNTGFGTPYTRDPYWQPGGGRYSVDLDEHTTHTFDLHYCGDGACDAAGGETASSCPQDCTNTNGALNSPSCNAITGWAYDPQSPSTPVGVTLYDKTTNQYFASATADNYDPTLISSCPGSAGGAGHCAFSVNTPPFLKDGSTHNIAAEAVSNEDKAAVVWLSDSYNSPKPLACSNPPGGPLTLTVNNTCQLPPPDGKPVENLSWTAASNMSPADPNAKYSIYRSDDSTGLRWVADVPANVTAWSDTSTLPHSSHAYQVYAINSYGSYGSVPQSITTNYCDNTNPLPPPAVTAQGCYKTADWPSQTFDVAASDNTIGNPNASGIQTVQLTLHKVSDGSVVPPPYSPTNPNSPTFPSSGQSLDAHFLMGSQPTPTLNVLYYFTATAIDFAGNMATGGPSTQFIINDTCAKPYLQTVNGDVHSNGNITINGVAPPP